MLKDHFDLNEDEFGLLFTVPLTHPLKIQHVTTMDSHTKHARQNTTHTTTTHNTIQHTTHATTRQHNTQQPTTNTQQHNIHPRIQAQTIHNISQPPPAHTVNTRSPHAQQLTTTIPTVMCTSHSYLLKNV